MSFSTRLAAAFGFLLLSTPAFAGEAYSFVTEHRDGFNDGTSKGRLVIEGKKFRMETEPEENAAGPRSVLISKDGGEHRFALNPENRTYFELEQSQSPAGATSPLFMLIPAWGNRTVSNVKLEALEKPEPETVSGVSAQRRGIHLSYDVAIEITAPPGSPAFKHTMETVHGKVKAYAVYWLAEDKAPLPFGFFAAEIRTGFPEIDGKLADALATLHGFVVKRQVTVTTAGDSYTQAQSSTDTTTVEGPRPAKTAPAMFEVPSGFKMHKPEASRPTLIAPERPPFEAPPGP